MYYGNVASVFESAKNDYEKAKLQLIFTLANRFRTALIRSIDATFGKAQRHLPVAARRRGASGGLRNSVALYAIDNGFAVAVGNAQIPYARIHEYGGIITPKNRQWLTIPSHKETYGYRAPMFPLFFHTTKRAAVLRFAQNYKSAKRGEIAFVLVKRVEIKEKAYIRKTLENFRNTDAKKIIADFSAVFGDTMLAFEV